jgi:LysR family hca operon transcriptional activator
VELRLLRYFVAVAEELNITRAAERLHTTQPNLSQQIRQIEGLLGAPLFHRGKHPLQLTETGRVFLPAAKQALACVEDAFRQARATVRTDVSSLSFGMIPGPEGMIFSRLGPLLLLEAPGTLVTLRSMTGPEIVQALLRWEITVGFLRGPIFSDELAWGVYSREEVVAVLPESCPQARFDRVPVSELAKLPHIAISEVIAPAVHRVADEIQARAGVPFHSTFCSESLMTSLNAVSSGLGFCLFAEYVGAIVPKGVVTRPLDLTPAPTLDLLYAYRKDERSPALASLLALLDKHAPFQAAAEPPRPLPRLGPPSRTPVRSAGL